MEINWDKTKELVFRRPNIRLSISWPEPLFNIDQVSEARLLGIIIFDKFNFTSHVNYLLTLCAQRCYLLKVLRQQGLPPRELNTVYNAIIVNILKYTLPTWAGFLTADLTNKINALFRKCHSMGFCLKLNTVSELSDQVDNLSY